MYYNFWGRDLYAASPCHPLPQNLLAAASNASELRLPKSKNYFPGPYYLEIRDSSTANPESEIQQTHKIHILAR